MNILKEGLRLKFSPSAGEIDDCLESSVVSQPFKKLQAEQEILDMLKLRVIEPFEGDKCLKSRIFCVKRDSKSTPSRPIINLKFMNRYICDEHFTMLSYKEVLNYITPNSLVTLVDISKAYYHIKIHPDHKKYLTFVFNDQVLAYNSLPFGYKLAPFIFNRVLGSCLAYIRSKLNIIILQYLDDIALIFQRESVEEAKSKTRMFVKELEKFGWSINYTKSDFNPTNKFTYLGVHFNSVEQTIFPSDKNIIALKEKANKMISQDTVSFREIESFMGSATFNCQFLLEGRLNVHNILRCALSNFNISQRDAKREVPKELKDLLSYWTTSENLKRRSFQRPSVSMETDASLLGWGAAIHCPEGTLTTQGQWSDNDLKIARDINNLEFLAIVNTISKFIEKLRNNHIDIFSDNMSTICAIKKMGSHKFPVRQKIAEELYTLLLKGNISISPFHIKGDDNILADNLSRNFNTIPIETELSKDEFQRICGKFNITPEIDLFASAENTKCKNYFTTRKSPTALGFNAMNQTWRKWMELYAFPPPNLIPKVLRKWNSDKAPGARLLLVAPLWNKSPFLPLLNQMMKTPIQKVKRKFHLHAFILS